MKKMLLVLILFSVETMAAQSVAKVENHPLQPMEVVLFAFGMEHPISIGTLSNSGELTLNFPTTLSTITEEIKADFMSDAAFTIFSNCDNSNDILSEKENVKATSGGYLSLSTKDNPYSGLIFLVTEEQLVPWIESSGDSDAVLGSYFKLVYMDSNFKYQGTCTSTVSYTGNESYETHYIYNLQLKRGFNFIEYKIETVETHKVPSMADENTFELIKKPSKIAVSSTPSMLPNTKWIAKYF
ncbi:hypothetical protein [Gelidibacter salicanalis]|uniref:GLPGLI family protein n=1 Tax=Gelidibacter salicanalis TaxID=291193 RepID=A0A934NKN4_9FLAO|nr:hypothetical protein [Gelidibacter salicanalis]MBJ7881507.1 hypothetical protein [Gelidibacter salicanalis]